MIRSLKHLWVYLIPFSIITISLALAWSGLLLKHPELAIGITYDLTILSPLLYLAVIWKKDIPKITALPLFGIGILISTLVLSQEHQTHLTYVITYLLPLVEVGLFIAIALLVRRIRKFYRANQATLTDHHELIGQAVKRVLGNHRVAVVFATEMSLFSYALFLWKRPIPAENQFTQTKRSTTLGLYGAVLMILVIESVPLHLLLEFWSPLVAWIVTILSIYSFFQLLGQMKALSRRFHELEVTGLRLRNGLFSELFIPYERIDFVEISERDLDNYDFEIKKIGMLSKLENHNIVLRLKEDVMVEKFYGLQSEARSIAFWVDDYKKFEEQLGEKM